MSTAAFLHGLVAWIASNDGRDPQPAVPSPLLFRSLIATAKTYITNSKGRTTVERHLEALKLVEDTIYDQVGVCPTHFGLRSRSSQESLQSARTVTVAQRLTTELYHDRRDLEGIGLVLR
jgi:hypothetical protein